MSKKTFILGVGVQKCGTTWFHKYIDSYDNINTGFLKEYHIWDALYTPECARFMASWKDSLFSKTQKKRRRMQRNQSEYFDYFTELLNDPEVNISADITPGYCSLSADVLSRIFHNFKDRGVDCKVVYLMRDPFERCWSAVRMNRLKSKPGKPVEGVSVDLDEETSLLHYSKTSEAKFRTQYHKTIIELEKSIPSENLFFGIYEDLMTVEEINRISQFIGVLPKPEFAKNKFNVSNKGMKISDAIIREVVNEYKEEYEICADRFPQTKSLWTGHKYL